MSENLSKAIQSHYNHRYIRQVVRYLLKNNFEDVGCCEENIDIYCSEHICVSIDYSDEHLVDLEVCFAHSSDGYFEVKYKSLRDLIPIVSLFKFAKFQKNVDLTFTKKELKHLNKIRQILISSSKLKNK